MAVISPRPAPRPQLVTSLTAAASRRSLAPGLSSMTIQEEGWQNRMWHFYDNLGCVHYGVQFKRNAASKVAYFAAELDDDSEDEPQPTSNQTVIDAVARLKSRFGDINEIVAEFMVHINVPGEGYLVGSDGLDGEEWDVWSVEEIRQSQFAAMLELQPDRAYADSGDYAARIWRPHPRNRHMADAPLRPVAQQCEQLLLLEDHISSAAKSRLPAGIMLLPSELSIDDMDAFEDELIAVLTTPIKEPDSAARYSPGFIRGPAEFLEAIRVISFAREMDETFAGMREELTRAIAAGIDLPAEIILGKADLNHWTGWEIDESAFRDHIDPDIVLILDSITRGYLHPALVEGGMGQEEAERFLIWRDLSDLGQKPVTVPEAIELNAAGIVSDRYVRDLIGATDEDAPEEPEPEPVIPDLVPMPAPPGPPVQADQVIVAAVARGRPLIELSSIDRRLLDRITEASEAAFNRVLERAGAKIRSHARKDRGISLSIDQLPNDQVTRHLGERLVAQLQITPSELVPPDSFDPLVKRLRVIMDGATAEVESVLESLTGARPSLDPRKIQGAITQFTGQLESLSLRLLFNPIDPGPGEVGDSVIPPNVVMDMMTEAAGGVPTGGPSDVRGFATGQESLQFLEQNGYALTGHQWEYGDSSTRRRPFPPHRRLDGVEFTDWDDDRLDTPASASFLNVSRMFPGDHYLCQCRTVPVALQQTPPAPAAEGNVSTLGMSPEEAAQFLATRAELIAKYPDAARTVRHWGTGDDPLSRAALRAEIVKDRARFEVTDPKIQLNRDRVIAQFDKALAGFDSGESFDLVYTRAYQEGGLNGINFRHPDGTSTVIVRPNIELQSAPFKVATDFTGTQYTTTHEFGHVVEHDLLNRLGNRTPLAADVEVNTPGLRTFQDAILRAGYNSPVSKYGRSNPVEGFAELFVANESGAATGLRMQKLLELAAEAETWPTWQNRGDGFMDLRSWLQRLYAIGQDLPSAGIGTFKP